MANKILSVVYLDCRAYGEILQWMYALKQPLFSIVMRLFHLMEMRSTMNVLFLFLWISDINSTA